MSSPLNLNVKEHIILITKRCVVSQINNFMREIKYNDN